MNTTARSSIRATLIALTFCLVVAGLVSAQDGKPASPKGSAATQIGDAWIEVEYSRPILRSRQGIFGSGEEYGKKLYAGAPLWRAGANVSTRIKTDVDLEIGGTKVPKGEYSLFIDLKEGGWTGVISKQPHLETPDRDKIGEGNTWGSYGYSDEAASK